MTSPRKTQIISVWELGRPGFELETSWYKKRKYTVLKRSHKVDAMAGGVPEWLKGADCKSVGIAYDGSNPSPSTSGCGNSSVGRALAFQANGRGFESRLPLKINFLRNDCSFII